MPQGILVIISAPGGGGKNAVIAELIRQVPNAMRFVTTTTRSPRSGERDGVDYFFVSRQEFEEKIQRGDFVEYNDMAGNLYGTDRVRLDEALERHAIVFAALDVNGRKSFSAAGIPHLSIFLLPDSLDALSERIRARGGMTEEQIAERMEIARREIAEAPSYDYRVVNREGMLAETAREALEILEREGVVDKKGAV